MAADVERGDLRIDGGLGLFADTSPVLLPGCCSWIDEAMEEWGRALELAGAEWSMLWTGHPWVMARRAGDALMISRPTHWTDPADLEPLVELPLTQLRQGLGVARAELHRAMPYLTDALGSPTDAGATIATRALGLRTGG